MKNRIKTLILCILVISSIICATFAAGKAASYSNLKEHYVPASSSSGGFSLRLENDEIIITASGEDVKTGINGEFLRSSDRSALETGITVDSYEELLKLLEDFNS